MEPVGPSLASVGDDWAEALERKLAAIDDKRFVQLLVNVDNQSPFVRRAVLREAALRILRGTDSPRPVA